MTTDVIQAQLRDMRIKAKKLRQSGLIPAGISGAHLEAPLSIQLNQKELAKLLQYKGEGSRIKIDLGSKKLTVLIKEVTRNLISGQIFDVSFQALQTDSIVRTKAMITLINTDKVMGFIEQDIYDVPYTAQAAHMVEEIVIDVDGMKPEERLFVRDLDISKNPDVELMIDPDAIIFSIRDKKRNIAAAEETAEAEAPTV